MTAPGEKTFSCWTFGAYSCRNRVHSARSGALLKNCRGSVRCLLRVLWIGCCTCQLFVLDFPDFGWKTLDQGRKTRKVSPNLAESWFLKGLGAARQGDGRCFRVVRYKARGDGPHDLVERPAPVCHLVRWRMGLVRGVRGVGGGGGYWAGDSGWVGINPRCRALRARPDAMAGPRFDRRNISLPPNLTR